MAQEILEFILKAQDAASGVFKKSGAEAQAAGSKLKALEKSYTDTGLSSQQAKGLIGAWEKQVQTSASTATGLGGKIQGVFKSIASSAGSVPGPLGGIASALGGVEGAAAGAVGPVEGVGAAGEGAALGLAGIATAGLGVAAFVGKAVGDFSGLALEVGNFADATGTSTEQASRFVEVAKNLNVPVEALQGAFAKLEKSIGNGSLEKIGVQAVKGKNGLTDMNATFLAVVEHLQAIPDEATRGAAAAKVFGKGWQSIAPIITQPLDELKSRLSDVQDSKIIDPSQVAEARQLRDTINELRNSFEGVTNSIGRFFLPAIQSVIAPVAQLSSEVDALFSKVGGLGGGFAKLVGNLPGIGSLQGIAGAFDSSASASDRLKSAATAVLPPLKLIPGGFFDVKSAAEKQAEATAKASAENDILGQSAIGLRDHQAELAAAGLGSAKASEVAASALEIHKAAIDATRQSAKDFDAAIAEQRSSLESEIATASKLPGPFEAATAAAQAFGNELKNLAGGAEAAQAADDAVQKSLNDLTASFKSNGKSIGANTDKALANRAAIRTSIDAINASAQANLANGATVDQVNARYQAQRNQLINQMVPAFHGSRAAAQNYINTLGLTPTSVTTAIKLSQRDQVIGQINDYIHNHLDAIPPFKLSQVRADVQGKASVDQLRADLASLQNKTVTVGLRVAPGAGHAQVVSSGSGAVGIGVFAQGGTIPGPLGKARLVVAHGGEVVLNPRQQSQLLFGLANGKNGVRGSGGGTIVNYNINVTSLDPSAAGGLVMSALKSYERRNGALPLRIA